MYSFPNFEPVHCSIFSSNCCFLSCIQVSQETVKLVRCSHLFENFPQFVVIYTVKGFSIVSEAEVDVFLEFPSFSYDPADVGNLISGSSAFSKCSWYNQKFLTHILLKPRLKDFEHNLASMWTFFGSWRKEGNSRKTSTSALLSMLKVLTVWIITNCGKFLEMWL